MSLRIAFEAGLGVVGGRAFADGLARIIERKSG
jgi:hypothetical protein